MTHARLYAPHSSVAEPSPALWEWIACIAVVTMMTGAFIMPIFSPEPGVETPELRLIWLPVYAVILGLVGRRAAAIFEIWPAVLATLALVGLAFVSSRWSLEPDTTVRRSIALGMSMLFALYLAAAWRGPQLLRMLCIAFLFMSICSLVLVFAWPEMGVSQAVNAGTWRGVWTEKNQTGMMMFTAILAGLALLISGARARWLAIATIVFAAIVLLGSQSKTSLLCTFIGAGVILGCHLLRKAGPAMGVVMVWLGVVVVVGVGAFFLLNPETFFQLLGKDASFTGRTDIWASLLHRAAERPWQGYGYAAFWGKESMPANWVRLETEWAVPSAHQGWLEVLIQLGYVGLGMVAATVLTALLLGIVRLPSQGVYEGYFGLAFLAAFIMLTLSESVMMLHHNFSWALFMAIFASRFAPVGAPRMVELNRRAQPFPMQSPALVFRSVLPVRNGA
ncbi:MAG: O-antigen ligase family protein [Caulobacteraceae bacterium]|nr:O-antigen ligase family protein [Caulobacteraceae bacterium]